MDTKHELDFRVLMRIFFIFGFFTSFCFSAQASFTDTLRLSLPEVVAMAKANSIAAKQAITVKETKYW